MSGEPIPEETLHTPLPYTQVIAEVARMIAVANHPEELLTSAVHKMAYGLGIPHIALYVLDTDKTSATLKVIHTPTPELFPVHKLLVPLNSNTLFGWAIANQRPYYLPHLETDNAHRQMAHIWSEAQSILVIPLMAGSQVYGLLDVQSGHKNAFPPALYNVLCTLADQMALSFLIRATEQSDQPRTFQPQKFETTASPHSLPQAFLQTFSPALTQPSAFYTTLADFIYQHFGSDLSFALALLNPEQRVITFPALFESGQPMQVDPLPLGEGLTSYIILHKRPLLVKHGVEETAQTLGIRLIGTPAKSWLGIPVLWGEEVLGALILQDLHREARFDENTLHALEGIAPLIAWMLQTQHLQAQVEESQHRAEEEHLLLVTLLEALPERIAIKDAEGRFLYANRALLRHYGVDALAQIVGKTEMDLEGDTGSLDLTQDLEVIESGEARINTPNYYFSLQGENVWELVSRIPIAPADGRSARLIRIAQDISEYIRAEQLAQRRAEQLLASAEIAREAISAREIDTMLQNATNQIRERLGYYHASVFLLDPLGRYAVLREASGEVGQIMKQSGHQLAVGSRSLVGQATALGRTVVANNVHGNPEYYPNPLLPETRSEIVVPLRVGERLLGALDVQSRSYDAFQPEDVQILETLASLLAIALDNTLLYTRTQQNLTQQRLFYRIISEASGSLVIDEILEKALQGLHEALPENRFAIFLLNREQNLELKAYTGYETDALSRMFWQPSEGIPGWVAERRQPLRISEFTPEGKFQPLAPGARSALALPLGYQNEVLGVICIESEQPAAFDESDQEIFATFATNLAAILTNARLVRQIQVQVERQRRLYEITSKIRTLTEVGNILQTSATEIGRALGAQRVNIQVIPPAPPAESLRNHPRPNDLSAENNGHERREDSGL
ncbi:GAF domain-containing protein [uncultured Thermanaerothrix sp.]|uniref:GAF domain-containing protein n=1 Tax=uncultured Thermanaerothrix sp. TaxID=1195149 RepID=UPI002631A337|nr:GAF domain-containing protein [uncultured Thermanaerothrix sp.]